ncbi:serine-type D-Ala-D-Ala carboxypeptidase [Acididesulfobacillus acetoxydans]|uniref:serine-type D-Ala-D-Ala carboxypeptidase n=1 Tax=Acididesulfobacillus acetoxydans TaxID=1561005 RepID=A0A8S0XXT2_9FIRM|nr:D-alanyl-D-alanine carboxypeptidase family protein [Acididesulfobacillus acetoxydans]CAA7601927.1 serine-type D-Ala-D-Ala carboxypeptidase [Acididesulfobacillus acetoxydans]CEJ08229.1 D-alanyl-D-alanine carboxypeptidase DacF [Acididesulfobacillus acetoxydans]
MRHKKKTLKLIAITILVLTLLVANSGSPASAQTANIPPQVQGEAAYLMDMQSGQVLYAKNPDEKLAPASTTKIMTALLALQLGNLNDSVTASKTMLNRKIVYGTQIYLTPGETMPLKDLLYAVLLNSANDAAVDVAEYVGGDLPHFVDLMNEKAKELGMVNTHFMNPTGLTEEGHFTTAHDLAILARAAYRNPVFRRYIATKTHTIPRAQANVPKLMVNENKLLWRDPDVDGMKTGYTAAAGNCLVATAERGGRQLVGVILKSPGGEMFGDMERLLNYGFSSSTTTAYRPAGAVAATTTVGKQQVNLVLAQPIYVTQKSGEPMPDLRLTLAHSQQGLKSVRKGDILAQLEVWEGTDLLDTINLLADRSVAPPVPAEVPAAAGYLYFTALGILSLFVLYLGTRWAQMVKTERKRDAHRRRESNP